MLRSNYRSFILSAIILFLCAGMLFAQPPRKAKERMDQLKKIKLLEYLDLKDDEADKFLTKYSYYEKRMDETFFAMGDAIAELKEAIKKKASKDKINDCTKKVSDVQNGMVQLMQEKQTVMATVLSDINYAKYLVFEHEFHKEMQKVLMKKKFDKKRPRHED